jgi:hypothetical protein
LKLPVFLINQKYQTRKFYGLAMSSSDGNTVESLQAQLAERDAKIEMLKSKTAAFVDKLKSGHAEALLQEQTARQQLQVLLHFQNRC